MLRSTALLLVRFLNVQAIMRLKYFPYDERFSRYTIDIMGTRVAFEIDCRIVNEFSWCTRYTTIKITWHMI